MENVLEVKNLTAAFRIRKKEYEVLHDVSFSIKRNETLCVVGESGCGKSVTTLCIMQLLPNNGRIVSGSITLDGVELNSPVRRGDVVIADVCGTGVDVVATRDL